MISALAKFGTKMATVLVFAVFLVNLTFLAHSANAQTTSSLLDIRLVEIDKAINAENWKSLKDILVELKKTRANVKDCNIESPLRLLYGHVALAIGENTAAVEQFYCVADSNGSRSLRDWQDWTQKLVDRNPNSASAHYFLGDAFARNGRLEQAKNEFDQALKIIPKHELALNARGVVKRLLFESDTEKFAEYELDAVADLSKVNQSSPEFADAWANRGVIGLRDESYLPRAISFFDSTLKRDPSYWLAHNGKAVTLGASGKYSEFLRNTETISQKAPNTPLWKLNTALIANGDTTLLNRGATNITKVAVMTAKNIAKNTTLSFDPVGFAKDMIRDLKRGGIFIYLKEGENFIVTEDGNRRLAGTWFALNYPSHPILPARGK